MCSLRNIAMRDYQESLTTRQTHGQTDGQTDAGQRDPPLLSLQFVRNCKSKSQRILLQFISYIV